MRIVSPKDRSSKVVLHFITLIYKLIFQNLVVSTSVHVGLTVASVLHFSNIPHIQTILEFAYDRLSHPKPSTLTDIDLEVISDDENLASIHSRCLAEEETGPSMNIQRWNPVIHTDHLDVEALSEEDMAIQCSIICYNYGVAYLCLCTLPTSRPFVDQIYTGALKMFQLAFLTLTSLHLKKEKLPSHEMSRALITGLFVLRNLILLSTTLGMAKERDEYLQRLVDLKQCIHEFCHDYHAIPSPAARAA